MRKLVILLVVIAAVLGGYYAYWYKKASDFRQMVVQTLDSFNADTKSYIKDLPLLRYDSVAITGFPFSMVVEVTKPVLNLPASVLVSLYMTGKPSPASPAPYEWVEEISYGDKITFTGNLAGTELTFTANGDRTHKSLIDRKVRHTLVSSSSSALVCHATIERAKGEPAWKMPVFTDLDTFLSFFRSLDCGAKGIAFKDISGNAVLLTSDDFSASASNALAEAANHKISFGSHLVNAKATPAFDAIMNDYLLMAYTLMGQANFVSASIPVSEYGTQNVDIESEYEGPLSYKALTKPDARMKLDINKFEFHDALLNSSAQMHVNLSVLPKGDRNLSVSVHAKSKASERYDLLGLKSFTAMLKEMQTTTSTNPQDQEMARKLAAFSPETLAAKVYPKLHNLGQASFDMDLVVKGPSDISILQHGSLRLDQFDMMAEPYGMKIKGSVDASVPGRAPMVDFSFNCLSCDAFVDDLGDYGMRVESVSDLFNSQPRPPYLSKELIEGTKQFLHGLSQNGNAKDILVHLLFKDGSNFSLSGKQLPEILALFNQTIAPAMSHAAPAVIQPQPSVPPTTR